MRMWCQSCREEYKEKDAGTCKECYEEASETEEELKREIEDLKAKVSFLRLCPPVDPHLPNTNADLLLYGVSESHDEAKSTLTPAVPAHRAVLMDLQNTAFTVQLGRGANIQLANAVINTGSSGATIQFGSVDFPAVVARTAATSACGTDSERPARRPHSAETSARSAHLSAPRVTVTQDPRRRISIFERISQPEAPATKRIVTGGRISVVTANTTTLPTGSPASGNNNVETFSSGGRLTRRQRRKRNAELRAQQQFSTHPSNVPAQELEATIPTQNGFSNLKWVKRNSSTGELKKSFWEQRCEVPTPPKKKEPESLSARVYRVLRTVKEKGLTKKRFQRPLTADVRRTPPRERLSFARVERRERRNNPLGEHRGVTPELHIRGSTTERSRWKGKQVWRPRPRRDDERKEREIDLGVTSGAVSRRSASTNKQRQKWVQKKTHDDTCHDGRHLGEFSKGSRRSLTPPKEESNFDRSPRVEEILLPNQEPEIQWRRRSEIRMLEEEEEDIQDEDEEEMNEAINMEVVYMLRHTNINDEAYYDEGEDDEYRQPPIRRVYRRQREAGSTADRGDHSQGEQEADEFEENLFDDENATLANIRRQMRRQMRAKDREISQLNEKMTEMMAQMGAMMQMMQRTATAGSVADPPADPPNFRMPQVSGHLSQASSSKPGKPKNFKKKTKLKKPKEKKTVTQKVIDSLDEYYQTVRQPIKLADFMSGLKVGETEEDGDADSLPTEVCRVISVVSSTPVNEECVKEAAVEFCMMVLPMDCSSEEDLYFPEEDESDPDLASQMEHVNLGSDSETTEKSPDTTMADSEENVLLNESEPEKAAQVQLRSDKILPPPSKKGVSTTVYEDAQYFIPKKLKPSSSLEAKTSSSKAAKLSKIEREKKQVGRKKAPPTLPKATSVPKERKHIPHLGSDTEEDDVTPAKSRGVRQPSAKRRKEVEYINSDYDYESIFMNTVQCVFSRRIDSLSVSDSVLVVTRVPLQYFKEIIPREVHKVEELTTRYLPPLEKGTESGSILYSVGIHEEENRDWCYKFVDSEELFPTRLPKFNTRGVQGMLRKQIDIPTSKRQLRTCLSLCSSLKPEWAYKVGLNKPRCGRVAGSYVYSTSHKKDRSSGTPISAYGRQRAIKS
ncbi:hypothetical protein M5K25_000655 [Dendrobium thyrsiflorum]|uniref:Uncharacterized protein n=1 Tax=Dendrobium thyrsiflorum TaxID=117978 RepID=A0ABD0W620_DENTH